MSTSTFTGETYVVENASVTVAAVPLALLPALALTQGGFKPDEWVWAGALAAWPARSPSS